jgi:hypothetical protein
MFDYKVVTVKMTGNNNYPSFYVNRPGQYKYELRNFSEASLGRIIKLLQSPDSLKRAELDIENSQIEYWFPVVEATNETA